MRVSDLLDALAAAPAAARQRDLPDATTASLRD